MGWKAQSPTQVLLLCPPELSVWVSLYQPLHPFFKLPSLESNWSKEHHTIPNLNFSSSPKSSSMNYKSVESCPKTRQPQRLSAAQITNDPPTPLHSTSNISPADLTSCTSGWDPAIISVHSTPIAITLDWRSIVFVQICQQRRMFICKEEDLKSREAPFGRPPARTLGSSWKCWMECRVIDVSTLALP